jgi:hypothetical protein
MSEDLLLRGMKESADSLSWADIAKSLNRQRSDVRARWKVIKDREPEDCTTDTDNEKSGDSVAVQSEDDQANTKLAKPAEETKLETPKWKKEKDKRGQLKDHDDRDGNTKPGPSDAPSNLDFLESNDACEAAAGMDDENQCQKHYLYHHVYKALYPAENEATNTEYLTERDCDILATIASMHTKNKLLEIKANFMNATGADVPLAVIRDWYEGSFLAHEDHPRGGLHQDPAERVEKWIDGVSMN